MSTPRVVAAAVLTAAAAFLSGCGASGGTITVEGVASAAPSAPAFVDVASVGPGAVTTTLRRHGYVLRVRVTPNRAAVPNSIVVSVRQDGVPVAGADVALSAAMTTMDMGTAHYALHGHGDYRVRAPAWVMPGDWELGFAVQPPGGDRIRFALDDRLR